MMTSFFQIGDIVLRRVNPMVKLTKEMAVGQFISYEDLSADHQTTHHQGILFPDVEDISLN